MASVDEGTKRNEKRAGIAIVFLAAAIALISARDHGGSANDGGRLATAESLVDRGTFVIDESIFVAVPPVVPGQPWPYGCNFDEFRNGTIDKVFIRGHFYSDKGPVLSILMAGEYGILHWATGLTAQERPDLYCRAMVVGTSGLAYVVAVWCVWRLFGRTPLTLKRRVAMTALFALGTLAMPYVRNVNNHIALLGAAAPLFLGLDALANNPRRWRILQILGLGTLAGLAYTMDQAAGPPLILAGAVVAYRTRSARAIGLFAFGALPWLALHHVVTYAIGGTIGPMSAVPEYFRWPGSPFDESNLTGVWGNQGVWGSLVYAGEMLIWYKRGFFLYNLPLFLVFPALFVLWRQRHALAEWPEVLLALVWCLATVALYTFGSTGFGGACTSIRLFVPLLAAGFYLICIAVRYEPEMPGDLRVILFWSLIAGALLWHQGAWTENSVSMLWLIEALGLLHWIADRIWRSRSSVPMRMG